MQYFPTESGRVRYLPSYDSLPGRFVYDYFIKDHLGNTRVVLTGQTEEDVYAATMEAENAAVENQLFSNVGNTAVLKPMGFDEDTSNHYVSRLDGTTEDSRIGPSIVLKVMVIERSRNMAGDTISMVAYGWYQSAVQPPPPGAPNLLGDVLEALTGGVIGSSGGKFGDGQSQAVSNTLRVCYEINRLHLRPYRIIPFSMK